MVEQYLTSQSYSDGIGNTRPKASSNLIGAWMYVNRRSGAILSFSMDFSISIISLFAFLIRVNALRLIIESTHQILVVIAKSDSMVGIVSLWYVNHGMSS